MCAQPTELPDQLGFTPRKPKQPLPGATTLWRVRLQRLIDRVVKRRPTFELALSDIVLRDATWFELAPLPIARDCFATTAIAAIGNVYVIGGRTDLGESAMVQTEPSLVHAYSRNLASWAAAAGMPHPHTGNATVTTPDGALYSLGGYIKVCTRNHTDPLYTLAATRGSISNLVQRYDHTANAWQLLETSIPNAKAADDGRDLIGRVFHAAAAAADGRILVFGGYGWSVGDWPDPQSGAPTGAPAAPRLTASAHAFDPGTQSWSTLAPMPTPRAGCAAVLGRDGLIHVIGGLGPDCRYSDKTEAYDPQSDTWQARAPMPTPRGALAIAMDAQGGIYATGGVGNEIAFLDVVERYDPVADQWASEPALPFGRISHGAAVLDDILMVIGGLSCPEGERVLLSSVIGRSV